MTPSPRFRFTATVAVAALIGASCGLDKPGEVASEELLGFDADQVMVDLETYMTREGLRRARLIADTAFTYQDEARVRLQNLEITFYAEGGETGGVLTARSGVYELESGDISVDGNVVVVGEGQGKRLATDRLRYVAEADSLYGDTAFVFHRGGVEMRGASFVSDPELENIQTESPSFVSQGTGAGAPIEEPQ
jgi:LPS export ABC transporter protein LptC